MDWPDAVCTNADLPGARRESIQRHCQRDRYLECLLGWICDALIHRVLSSQVRSDNGCHNYCSADSPARVSIEYRRLVFLSEVPNSTTAGVNKKLRVRLGYCNTAKNGRLSTYSNPRRIDAGGVAVSQISSAGTAEQTMIVRMISHTAVIFSTINYRSFSICKGYIKFQEPRRPEGRIPNYFMVMQHLCSRGIVNSTLS